MPTAAASSTPVSQSQRASSDYPQVSAPDAEGRLVENPVHVAIIMDGNNRWARAHGLHGAEGHRAGGKQLRSIVKAAVRAGIKVLTVFAFSSENWRRPPDEVQALMSLFIESLDREVPKLDAQGIGLRFIGDLTAFSADLQQRMQVAQNLTAQHTRMVVVCAVNYGGRWDMAQAAQRLVATCLLTESGADQSALNSLALNSQALPTHLALTDCQVVTGPRLVLDWQSRLHERALHEFTCLSDLPPVDLCIRTGGEKRISNFLLWQLAYAELIFTEQLWPDFDENSLLNALQEFRTRQRRFGRTVEQVQSLVACASSPSS